MRKPDLSTRLAVTGAGIICSIGRNKGEVWESVEASRAGIAPLTRFPGETFPTTLAAEVPMDLEALLPASGRELRRLSRTDRLAVIAAAEAITESESGASRGLRRERTAVSSGTSTGGLFEGERFYVRRQERGARRTRVSDLLQQPTSAPSDAIARVFALGGGVISNATACASAGAAIGMAGDLLRSRRVDAVVAGGSDALCRITYSGFNVLQAVDPQPCTPFGEGRKGITLGEGAAYLVLERWDDAISRGAAILAELCGYGASCDAYHATAPAEDGRGAEAAMRAALAEGHLSPERVDYVNAHGTGTPLNDSSETRAILAALGHAVPVSSSKSFFGHTLGAAGAVEAVISILALQRQVAPPTLRLATAAADCTLDYVPESPRAMEMTNVLSNTFGFGGSNVSLLFRRA